MTSKNKTTDHPTNEIDNSQVPVTYEINQEILNKARQTKDELTVISNRLEKLDEHKSKVSSIVFQKLKNEYIQKQKEILLVFESCKTELRRELKKLVDAERQNAHQLENHQLSLEEVKLRGVLGEYDEEKVREIVTIENKMIENFQQANIKIKNDILMLEEITGESFDRTLSNELVDSIVIDQDQAQSIDEQVIDTGVLIESRLISELNENDNAVKELTADAGIESDVLNISEATIAVVTDGKHSPAEDLSTGQHMNPDEEEATVCVQGTSSGGEDQTLENESEKPHAKIIIYEQENVIGECTFLSECRIGRTKTADIFLKDDTVSRNHALIVRNGDEYKIFDQNSANGVIVNGDRVTEAVLKNEDLITIGIFTLIIKIS